MDWFDHYLDALSDGTNVVYPPDTNTWRPVKPTKQQQSLMQDSIIADMVRMRMIQEKRMELEEYHGDSYDNDSPADLNVTVTPSVTPTETPTPTVTNTPTPSITPSITPTNTVTPTPSVTYGATPTPTVTPTNTVTPSPSTLVCNVSCTPPSSYFAFDASGSMNGVDIGYNGNMVSRAFATDLLLDTYSTSRYAEIRGGTLRAMTDRIKNGIQQAPLNSKVCSVVFITDATDFYGGVTAINAWNEISSQIAGKPFKLEFYVIGFLSNVGQRASQHLAWLNMINDFKNTKPSFVTNFQFGVYSSYDEMPTSSLSQLAGDATAYVCECENNDIVRVSNAGGVTLGDAIDTAKSICC